MKMGSANLSNPADDRVIDRCVELLDAGQPLSEIINEAKRLSRELPPLPNQSAAEESVIEQDAAVACTAEQPTTAKAADKSPTDEPVRGRRGLHRGWPIAAAIFATVAAGAAGPVYLPRLVHTASITIPASAPILNSTSSVDVSTAPASELAPLTAAQIKALVDRGTALVGSGDIAAARIYYEPAVRAGDAQAAIYLGETYDPSFLKRGRFGKAVRGDAKLAEHWYHRARELGSSDAEDRLNAMRR